MSAPSGWRRLAQTDGYRRFMVNPDGTLANPTFVSIPADGPKHALVAQAVFSPDGSIVYSAVNGQNRVVAINGQPAVQPTMVVTLSCDHRALDGARGAQFIGALADLIEEPLALLV